MLFRKFPFKWHSDLCIISFVIWMDLFVLWKFRMVFMFIGDWIHVVCGIAINQLDKRIKAMYRVAFHIDWRMCFARCFVHLLEILWKFYEMPFPINYTEPKRTLDQRWKLDFHGIIEILQWNIEHSQWVNSEGVNQIAIESIWCIFLFNAHQTPYQYLATKSVT